MLLDVGRSSLFLGEVDYEDDISATQRSILEELHYIHEESQTISDIPEAWVYSQTASPPAPLQQLVESTRTPEVDPIDTSETTAIGAEIDDHSLLFAGLEDDTFDNVELSPQRTRTRSQVSLSSPVRPPAETAPTQDLTQHVMDEADSADFDDDDLFDPFYDPPDQLDQTASMIVPAFAGFKTGRGQSVQLSEKALDRAKKLFGDFDADDGLLDTLDTKPLLPLTPQPVFVPPIKTTNAPRSQSVTPALPQARSPLREVLPPQSAVSTPISKPVLAKTVEILSQPEKAHTGTLQRPPLAVLPVATFSSPAFKTRAPPALQGFSPLRSNTETTLGGTKEHLARLSTPQSANRISLGTTTRPGQSTGKKRPLPKFVTPFKNGKRPKSEVISATGSPLFLRTASSALPSRPLSTLGGTRIGSISKAVFDLTPRTDRRKLADLGRPETLTSMQMIAAGAPDEIVVILQDAAQASRYAFDTPDGQLLGQDQAFDELQRLGCHDTTLPWVKNHWTLILWKMASHTRLNPRKMSSRWDSQEVMRQLLYRYERETNQAHRSCIRRIQERDSAPGRAMVLFVTKIYQEEEEVEMKSGGTAVQKSTVIDLSDGWYKIQAQADSVLAQACSRGRIKAGNKLAIMGARLENNGEGNDVLSSYHTSRITLNANSVSLARWDAKLGFVSTSFVAGLRSLTAEGGSVALMDIEILKVFPLAYVDAERGGNPGPPRGVAEEAEAREAWLQRREDARQRMELDLESQNRRLEDLNECLASLTGDSLLPVLPEDPTGRLEAEASRIFELLCDHESPSKGVSDLVVQRSMTVLLPWLRSMAKKAYATQAETGWMRMQGEMDRLCPPRKVRAFRVVRFRDARLPPCDAAMRDYVKGSKNPHARTVQLTVWDAADLCESLKEGQRFLVTNLVPTSKSAWRKADEAADIFLATRRDTKWRAI